MAKAKIQTGDTVKVIAGGFKGTIGQVTKVVRKRKGLKEVKKAAISTVAGIAKYRKSFKYNGQSYPGEMTQKPRLIDLSNLSHVTADGGLTKVAIKVADDGTKTRIQKKSGMEIPKVILEKVKAAKPISADLALETSE
jgi:large subunit ribosomal protein L24